MTHRLVPGAVSGLLLLGFLCGGCTSGHTTPGPVADATTPSPAVGVPTSPAELERLLLDQVPSGLPMVPDDELDPPAGEKTIDDVAQYGEDPDEQRAVLEDYGYLWGWERFWRTEDRLTSVFIDQFGNAGGAVSYADDLARNDAEFYGGSLDRSPSELPDGCVLMVHDHPSPDQGFTGPVAFAWCAPGVFTVAVAAVADSPAEARAELVAVTIAQLNRLPTA